MMYQSFPMERKKKKIFSWMNFMRRLSGMAAGFISSPKVILITWNINEKLTYFVAGTYIRATEDIWAWSGGDDGIVGPADMGPDKSDDLGEELDMKLTWKVSPGLAWIFRGGYFWAGDGAGYLINGNINTLENAYELRTTIKFSFGGLSIGK